MREMFFIGDVHNIIPTLIDEIISKNINKADLIQVGDFGIGFPTISWDDYDETYSNLSDILEERDCMLYVVRGNHDCPLYFDGTFEYNCIKFVKDYSVLELNDKRILCIGGGVSVDRTHRKRHNLGYWIAEAVDTNISKLDNVKDIDIVVTHSNTTFAFPNSAIPSSVVNYWRKFDDELWNDIITERRYLSEAYEKLKVDNNIKLWVYGHYHNSNIQKYENTEFRLLNIHEWYKYK